MKAYVSYDINCEEIYDEDSEVYYRDDYWLISNVFVEKAFRGQGVARKLMLEAIAEMKAERPELKIKLVAMPQDDETDIELLGAFYESLGFEAIGDEIGTMEL
jgi:ribosomal protein S18 acetylase RimI-like enzyme